MVNTLIDPIDIVHNQAIIRCNTQNATFALEIFGPPSVKNSEAILRHLLRSWLLVFTIA